LVLALGLHIAQQHAHLLDRGHDPFALLDLLLQQRPEQVAAIALR
jgi:hypothetical protein